MCVLYLCKYIQGGTHMISGITGSREGISFAQLASFLKVIEDHNITEIHHGCCNGADEMAVIACHSNGLKVIGHPPSNPKEMSSKSIKLSEIMLPKKAYLDRNKEIVNASKMLIALPRTKEEEIRSGTWSTIRYA